ncbi:MAG: ABC transporter permease [Acidobacteria bacterium]|nr:ABC transporter permease [Acidobacteriota bacterium]
MKYLGLLLHNLFRNRRRTVLTVTSVAASLFLVATLMTLLTELESPVETPVSALRLITRHRVSLINALPVSYRAKIAQVDGVESVIGSMWFGGVYKDPKNFFMQFAVDTDRFFDVNADLELPEDQKKAFLEDRTGAIAGDNIAGRFGWKAGDRITLQGALFDFDAELTLRGIYSGGSDVGSILYFHWDYFNEALGNPGFTGTFSIRARSPEDIPAIAERVDAMFINSSSPTKTETEKAFVLGFASMMGNVRLLVTSIASVVIFTIVLVAANTMAMSIRERVREIGILKALGFRRSQVLGLLLAESLILSLAGALIGAFGARLLFGGINMAAITGGFFPRFYVTPGTLALSLGIGIFVGVVSAGIPAWQAARRPVVAALREVV